MGSITPAVGIQNWAKKPFGIRTTSGLNENLGRHKSVTRPSPEFTNYEWQEFLEQHNLVPSISRRGICWDNVVVGTFF